MPYHIDDIASVLFHGRANAQVEELFDEPDGLAFLFAHTLVGGMMLAVHEHSTTSLLGLALLLVELPNDDRQFGIQVLRYGGE